MSLLHDAIGMFKFGRKRKLRQQAEIEQTLIPDAGFDGALMETNVSFESGVDRRPESPLDCPTLNKSEDVAETVDEILASSEEKHEDASVETIAEVAEEPVLATSPETQAQPIAEVPAVAFEDVTIPLQPESTSEITAIGTFEMSEPQHSFVADTVSMVSSIDANLSGVQSTSDSESAPSAWQTSSASTASSAGTFGDAPDMAAVQADDAVQPTTRDAVIDELIMALMDEARTRANSTIEAYETLSLKVSDYAKQSQTSARTAWRMVGSMAAVIAIGGMAGTYVVGRALGRIDSPKTRTAAVTRAPHMARTAAYEPDAQPESGVSQQKVEQSVTEMRELTDEMREAVSTVKQLQADQTRATEQLQTELHQAQQARAHVEEELRNLRQTRANDVNSKLDTSARQTSYTPATQPAAKPAPKVAAPAADVSVNHDPLANVLSSAQPASMRQGPSVTAGDWNSLLNGR